MTNKNARMKPKNKGPKALFTKGRNVYDRPEHIPSNALDPRLVVVFLAVYHGADSFRAIARAIGTDVACAYTWALKAREIGLIDFDTNRKGTMHTSLQPMKGDWNA